MADKNLTLRIIIGAKDNASKALTSVTNSLAKITAGVTAMVTAATAWVGGQLFGDSVEAAEKLEIQMGALEGAIAATGSAAGLTAEEIDEMARRLDEATLGSAEGFRDAAVQLLTFKSVGKDAFETTLALAQDLASAGFGTVESSAVQLGKALEDPVKGLAALGRSGVTFTEAQKEVIKGLVATGEAAQAQQIILDAVAGQVGGVASAMGGGLAGAVDLVGKKFTDLKERLGSAMIPVLTSVNTKIAEFYQRLNDSGAVDRFGEAIAAVFGSVAKTVEDFLNRVDFTGLAENIRSFADSSSAYVKSWAESLRSAGDVASTTLSAMSAAWNGFRGGVEAVASAVTKATAYLILGYAKLAEAAEAVGLASEGAATRAAAAAYAMSDAADSYEKAAVASFSKVSSSLRDLSDETDAAETASASLASAQDELTEKTDKAGLSLAEFEAQLAAEALAAQEATPAIEEHATAVGTVGQQIDLAKAKLGEYGEVLLDHTAIIQEDAAALEVQAKSLKEVEDALAAITQGTAARVADIQYETSLMGLRLDAASKEREIDLSRAQARKDLSAQTAAGNALLEIEIQRVEDARDAKQLEADALHRAAAEKRAEIALLEEYNPALARQAEETERAAEKAALEAQNLALTVDQKKLAAQQARELAEQESTLADAFEAAGQAGVASIEDIMSAVSGANTSGEIEALGDALEDAFRRGALSAEEYKQALDQIAQKQQTLKDQAAGQTYESAIDIEGLAQQVANGETTIKAIYDYLRSWTDIPGGGDASNWIEAQMDLIRDQLETLGGAPTSGSSFGGFGGQADTVQPQAGFGGLPINGQQQIVTQPAINTDELITGITDAINNRPIELRVDGEVLARVTADQLERLRERSA